ncbi:MAG: lytic transglycosylase domain-containing protein, partial [Mesorhizobium sp.]|nr:lytic transglycosylase domain-containing protein [Mesorhizobium sp.]
MTAPFSPRHLLAALVCVALPIGALAAFGNHPFAFGSVKEPRTDGDRLPGVDPITTAGISVGPFEPGRPPSSTDIDTLKLGLIALGEKYLAAARATRDSLPADSLDRRILTWAIAMNGADGMSSREIAATLPDLAGWPGMATLRNNGERALYREDPEPAAVVQAFAGGMPQTLQGARILARAHVALGNTAAAQAALSAIWRAEKLDDTSEAAVIKEFGSLLPAADHRARMEKMLYLERARSAARVATLAGAPALNAAWAAVIRGDKAAGKLLDQVPEAERGAGYVFAKARFLRRAKKYTESAAVMLTAPTDRESLVDPDAWWVERRALSRELLDLGDVNSAYRLAAAHAAESPALAVDAEFHAGWYALRGLKDPDRAAGHFSKIAEIAEGSTSRARAYYWLGRAAEAGGPGASKAYYQKAASYGTAFYGQLAAAKLGRGAIALGYPEPSAADRRNFHSREAVRAIKRIEEAGFAPRSDMLYRDLAQQLTSPGELALLAAMAEGRGDHFLALRVGKIAAARGLAIGSLAHPTGAIPPSARVSDAGMALAYAIARQESEFNVGAVSGAGARGLLQLLPATAKDMARKAGLP